MASSVTTSLTARGRHNPPGHYVALSPSSPLGDSSPCAARASRTPRWKLARRSLVCAADLVGAGGAGAVPPTPPGTRFAFGTRFGSPVAVVPLETGVCATSAASQPASAGEDQSAATAPAPLSGRAAGWSAPCRPRRNQSDSTDSKIGSRFSSPVLAGGGTITPCCAVWPVVSVRNVGSAISSSLGRSSPGLKLAIGALSTGSPSGSASAGVAGGATGGTAPESYS